MSGVEEVAREVPPDEDNDTANDATNDNPSTETETNSLTGSWTIVDKEDEAEESLKKKDQETNSESGGSSIEVLDNKDSKDKIVETDSESIETISDDEIMLAQYQAPNLDHSYNLSYPSDQVDSGTSESLPSLVSTVSVASDGIPINDDNEEGEGDRYAWINEGQREIPDDRVEDIVQEQEEEDHTLEPGEPGYDLDDDGLPGEPLPPLPQEVELYPSQELDPSFQAITKERIYKHDKNLKVDHLLTAILVLALALVVGLGIGHFLGLSERLEVQEMYENLQEERLDILQEDLVSCIEGEEGNGGDDQDLDDKVIKQLWEENQELRDQVHQLKTDTPNGDDALAAVLRDRINDLLTANADLERQVARLRYADAARGAAESVETLDKLRRTRDTLNDIVTENDQLKIEVGKTRYGEHVNHANDDIRQQRDQLLVENGLLKSKIALLEKGCSKPSDGLYDSIQSAFDILQHNIVKDEYPNPWPAKRTDELSKDPSSEETAQYEEGESSNTNDESEDDDDEIKSESMNNLSKYLTELAKLGKMILDKDGSIDLSKSEHFLNGLKTDVLEKFEEAGKLAKDDLNLLAEKFSELKTFINTESIHDNIKATKVASVKLLKSLIGTIKDLSEASEDAAEKSDWYKSFQTESEKIKVHFDKKWVQIKNKWSKIIDGNVDDDDDESEDRRTHQRKEKQRRKWSGGDDDDEDEGYHSESHHSRDKYKQKKGKNSSETTWDHRRSIEREKQRREQDKSDWIFERAKQRKDIRYEETRGDWYFDRKRSHEDSKHCHDDDCREHKDKGEKYKREASKKHRRERGETKQRFSEEVKYAERHYHDRKSNRQ